MCCQATSLIDCLSKFLILLLFKFFIAVSIYFVYITQPNINGTSLFSEDYILGIFNYIFLLFFHVTIYLNTSLLDWMYLR